MDWRRYLVVALSLVIPGQVGLAASFPVAAQVGDPPFQLLTAAGEVDNAFLIPDVDEQRTSVTVTVDCNPITIDPGPYVVDHEVSTESGWATTTVEPSSKTVDLGPNGCLASESGTTYQVNVTLRFGGDVPAFFAETVTFTASSSQASNAASKEWTAKSAFAGSLDVRAETNLEGLRNSRVEVPITMDNLANGDVEVRFDVLERPSMGGSLSVPAKWIVPAPYRVTSPVQTVIVDYISTHEGEGAVTETFSLGVRAVSADDTELLVADEVLDFSATITGVYIDINEAPAASFWSLAALALGMCVWRRRTVA